MSVRPGERKSGAAADHMGDLVEFNRPSGRWGRRGTIHGVSEKRPFISQENHVKSRILIIKQPLKWESQYKITIPHYYMDNKILSLEI